MWKSNARHEAREGGDVITFSLTLCNRNWHKECGGSASTCKEQSDVFHDALRLRMDSAHWDFDEEPNRLVWPTKDEYWLIEVAEEASREFRPFGRVTVRVDPILVTVEVWDEERQIHVVDPALSGRFTRSITEHTEWTASGWRYMVGGCYCA